MWQHRELVESNWKHKVRCDAYVGCYQYQYDQVAIVTIDVAVSVDYSGIAIESKLNFAQK
jgi:hypothetical protein